MSYDRLYNLKPEDYQHNGEKIAIATMKKIPIFDIVLAKVIDTRGQLNDYAEACGNYFRINEHTDKRVHDLYKLALKRLDINEEYPLFSKPDYEYNAYTSGVKKPYIVLHTSIINDMTDEELLYIIGHEIGHIKSGHCLYRSMASMLNGILSNLGRIAQKAGMALSYAIKEWGRNAEYTADRAGLIASANIDSVNCACMKMLGRSDKIDFIDFSFDKVINQIDDFQDDTSDIIGKLINVSYTAQATHPWTILRLKQINEWYNSGKYQNLINEHIVK